MEEYKIRFVNEYKELKNRYQKLHNMLVRFDAGKLDFTPTCPIQLLREQAAVMGKYLYILEERAVIEDIDLTRAVENYVFDFNKYESMTVETEDGERIADITQDEINLEDGYRIRMKPI